MVKIFSHSSSQRLEQIDDQGMRDGKGGHTIRDSCYHRETGVGGSGSEHVKGMINHQPQKFTPTWACILSDRNIFCTPRGGRTTAQSSAPGAFLVNFKTYLRAPLKKKK